MHYLGHFGTFLARLEILMDLLCSLSDGEAIVSKRTKREVVSKGASKKLSDRTSRSLSDGEAIVSKRTSNLITRHYP